MTKGSWRSPALAVLGAFAFSNTLLWGRAGQRAGAGLPAMLTIRFALTGALLLGVLALLRRPLLPAPGERATVFGLGVIAYGFESVFFFQALQHGSTSIVVLLFYTHVVVVAVCEVLLGALRPTLRIVAAVLVSILGGAIVALASGGDVDIEPLGLFYVFSCAALYSSYIVASARVVRNTEPLTSAAWVAIGASFGVAVWGVGRGDFGAMPGDAVLPTFAFAVATAAAFTLWFTVVGSLGSARTSIIMMLEAPFGIALTAIAFDDPLSVQVVTGGLFVLGAALLASLDMPIESERLEAATSP